MGGEDCRDIDSALLAEGKCYTREPFVEVCNDSFGFLVIDELKISAM